MLNEHEIQIRVRYQETDGQGRVHHANYLTYFEMGRVELLRAAGHEYRKLEEAGVLMVVYEMNCRYLNAACFDDVLILKTTTKRITPTRIFHEYVVSRGQDIIVEGKSTVACVDAKGNIQRLPEWIVMDDESA